VRLLKAAGPGSRYSHPGYSWNRALSGSKHPSATVARAISQMITRRCSGFKLESAESAGTERSRQGSWIGLRFQRMPQINQESLAAIQPDLISGESILWAGQPNTRVIFHRVDVFMIRSASCGAASRSFGRQEYPDTGVLASTLAAHGCSECSGASPLSWSDSI